MRGRGLAESPFVSASLITSGFLRSIEELKREVEEECLEEEEMVRELKTLRMEKLAGGGAKLPSRAAPSHVN